MAGSIWVQSDQHHANASLRSVLWRVQQADAPIIESSSTHLQLDPDVDVDLHSATDLLHDVLSGRTTIDADAIQRVSGLGQQLLPDWYDEWVAIEQERYRQLRLHALERLSERLSCEQRWGEAIQVGLAAVAADPLRESAHRVTIIAHLGQGNVSEAIRQYDRCRRLLRRHVGAEPSRHLENLIPRSTSLSSSMRPCESK